MGRREKPKTPVGVDPTAPSRVTGRPRHRTDAEVDAAVKAAADKILSPKKTEAEKRPKSGFGDDVGTPAVDVGSTGVDLSGVEPGPTEESEVEDETGSGVPDAEGLAEDVERALDAGKSEQTPSSKPGSPVLGRDDFDFWAYRKKVVEIYEARKLHFRRLFDSQEYYTGKTPLRVETLIDVFAMRCEMDQNINVFVWGDKGLGKSSMCFSIALIVDPEWKDEMEGRRVNTLPDILQIGYNCSKMVSSGEYTKDAFKHACVVLDEAGGAGAAGGKGTIIVSELIDYFEMSRVLCVDLLWNAPDPGRFRTLIPTNFQAKIFVSNRNHAKKVIIGWLEVVGMIGTWKDFFNPECIEWDADGICHPRCWRRDGHRKYCRHNRPEMKVRRKGVNFSWKCGRVRRGKRIVVPYCPKEVHEKQDGVKFDYMTDKFGSGLRRTLAKFKENKLVTYECRTVGFLKREHAERLGGTKFAKAWETEGDGGEQASGANALVDVFSKLLAGGGGKGKKKKTPPPAFDERKFDPLSGEHRRRATDYEEMDIVDDDEDDDGP